jgi:hypothetical protein
MRISMARAGREKTRAKRGRIQRRVYASLIRLA